MNQREARRTAFEAQAAERILVLDGAMGTQIQDYSLGETGYRGKRFAGYPIDQVGNNDLLNITQPGIVKEIHTAFLDAGADIVTTNTFNATAPSMADYRMDRLVHEINYEGARLAREAAEEASTPARPRFVAGAIGPTGKTTSISPDVSDPAYRAIDFDEIEAAYLEAAAALIEGGVDVLILETVFDTLNAKAAIFGLEALFDDIAERVPLMISGTITDRSGRTLTGQTTEAFWNSVRHAAPISVGLNCSLGAEELRPYVAELSRVADTLVSAHPNAGLPNEFGEYDEPPEVTAGHLRAWAEDGLVNIVGGCCGTTPSHIQAIAEVVAGLAPRPMPRNPIALRLSGLEPFEVRP